MNTTETQTLYTIGRRRYAASKAKNGCAGCAFKPKKYEGGAGSCPHVRLCMNHLNGRRGSLIFQPVGK